MKILSELSILISILVLLCCINPVFAQDSKPGEETGEKIAERVESQETSSSDQKLLVKEIAEAARKAGKENPDDPDKVKKAVKDKLDEIRDRTSSGQGKTRKPGGKNNTEIEDWTKKLKRELTDKSYISLTNALDSDLLLAAKGTGRTTGHIADLTLNNQSDSPVTVEVGPYYIPSSGNYQPYLVPNLGLVTVPPKSNIVLPINGFCADIHIPPVPSGSEMPIESWVSPKPYISDDWLPAAENGWKPNQESILVVPGTDTPLQHQIDINKYPSEAAPILLDMVTRITSTFDSKKNEGTITTPFSGNPEKERESVIQQAFWISAAALTGVAYKLSDFAKKTEEQFESNSGKKIADLPDEEKKQLDSGISDFWNTFQAVGVEAKVISATANSNK